MSFTGKWFPVNLVSLYHNCSQITQRSYDQESVYKQKPSVECVLYSIFYPNKTKSLLSWCVWIPRNQIPNKGESAKTSGMFWDERLHRNIQDELFHPLHFMSNTSLAFQWITPLGERGGRNSSVFYHHSSRVHPDLCPLWMFSLCFVADSRLHSITSHYVEEVQCQRRCSVSEQLIGIEKSECSCLVGRSE